MKLWEKVNNLTGYDSKSRNIVEYLNAAAKFLIGSLPEKYLWSIASEEEITGWTSAGVSKIGGGSGTAYDKIIAVYRFDGGKKRMASESPDDMAYTYDETSSITRATKMFPAYYRLADKIYIKPDPDYNPSNSGKTYTNIEGVSTTVASNEGDKGIIIYAAPPTVTANTQTWNLVEFEHVAITYAASLDAKRKSDLSAVDEDFELAQIYQGQSQDFYQRCIQEFQAITGGLAADPQKQATQRAEEGRST
tara:strand:+ start:42827 stop:43573 length:747 start_codon:yes stop_codon:yes gene_type:complete